MESLRINISNAILLAQICNLKKPPVNQHSCTLLTFQLMPKVSV